MLRCVWCTPRYYLLFRGGVFCFELCRGYSGPAAEGARERAELVVSKHVGDFFYGVLSCAEVMEGKCLAEVIG